MGPLWFEAQLFRRLRGLPTLSGESRTRSRHRLDAGAIGVERSLTMGVSDLFDDFSWLRTCRLR